MERVTIGKLKNELSAWLRKVRAGETVLVMDRRTVIARIEPARVSETDDEKLSRLEAKGIVRRPRKPWDIGFLKKKRPRSRKSVLDALLEERAEGR